SDIVGRRPVLAGSLVVLALTTGAQAMAGSFSWVAVWATAGGGCAGAYTGVVFTEVSARVPDRQRGRALGWVMSGQSLTLVVGGPRAAGVGSWMGWRGWLICLGAVSLLASLGLLATASRRTDSSRRTVRPSLGAALSRQVLALMG